MRFSERLRHSFCVFGADKRSPYDCTGKSPPRSLDEPVEPSAGVESPASEKLEIGSLGKKWQAIFCESHVSCSEYISRLLS